MPERDTTPIFPGLRIRPGIMPILHSWSGLLTACPLHIILCTSYYRRLLQSVRDQALTEHSASRRIYCDNGSEFTGRLVGLLAYGNKVTLEFSRPGKSTDIAFIESFNGSLRDECLNVHCFRDLTDAREKLQAWQKGYNKSRPHRSLNNLSPLEYKDN